MESPNFKNFSVLEGGNSMFCPMYVKTEYSLLQSLIRIPNYIAYAKKEQFTALSISDHNLSGGMEFYKACQKEKIKPVIGLEITLEAHKILLYAKDQIGVSTTM